MLTAGSEFGGQEIACFDHMMRLDANNDVLCGYAVMIRNCYSTLIYLL